MRIEVVYCPSPGEVDRVELQLVEGATAMQALLASRLLQRHPQIDLALQRIGVWGRLVPADAALRDGDRVELYRPLEVDPKQARRLRASAQQRRQRAAPRRR